MFDNAYALDTPLLKFGKRHGGKLPIRYWYNRCYNKDLGRHIIDYIFYDRNSRKWRQDETLVSEQELYSFFTKA